MSDLACSFTYLNKTKSDVLYEMPAGRPDRRAGISFLENRVEQQEDPALGCALIAMNLLRPVLAEGSRDREYEQIASDAYRANFANCEQRGMILEIVKVATLPGMQEIIACQRLADTDKTVARLVLNSGRPLKDCEREAINAFLSQDIEHGEKYYRAGEWNAWAPFIPTLPPPHQAYLKTLKSVVEPGFLQTFATGAIAERFGFIPAQWTPSTSNCQNLIDELTRRGPLLLVGKFGRTFYEDDAEVREGPSGHRLRFWPKGAKRIGRASSSIAILIMGGKITRDAKTGTVYSNVQYVDPSDASRAPWDYYCMSYKTLVENAGKLISSESMRNCYAYYQSGCKRVDPPISSSSSSSSTSTSSSASTS